MAGKSQDLTGKTFGDWTAISVRPADTKGVYNLWLCLCKCGFEREFTPSYLNTGTARCCSDCVQKEIETENTRLSNLYVGKKAGMYTVVQLMGRNKWGSREWLCRCDCGNEIVMHSSRIFGSTGMVQARTSCIKCRKTGMELENRVTDHIPHRFWKRLQDRTNRPGYRNQTLTLTQEEAFDLYLAQDRKCALSGVELYFTKLRTNFNHYTNASIDRIDSSKPYEIGNVQWVDKKINMMKGTLSQVEFQQWCQKVTDLTVSRGI